MQVETPRLTRHKSPSRVDPRIHSLAPYEVFAFTDATVFAEVSTATVNVHFEGSRAVIVNRLVERPAGRFTTPLWSLSGSVDVERMRVPELVGEPAEPSMHPVSDRITTNAGSRRGTTEMILMQQSGYRRNGQVALARTAKWHSRTTPPAGSPEIDTIRRCLAP
jgi:hypothetical protein